MAKKRTRVKAPWWVEYEPGLAEALVEVGPRQIWGGEPALPGENARRKVFLNGEEIGVIEQKTRRGERPVSKGSSIVIVTGHPTEWAIDQHPFGMRYKQMNEAAYRLIKDVLERRAKEA